MFCSVEFVIGVCSDPSHGIDWLPQTQPYYEYVIIDLFHHVNYIYYTTSTKANWQGTGFNAIFNKQTYKMSICLTDVPTEHISLQKHQTCTGACCSLNVTLWWQMFRHLARRNYQCSCKAFYFNTTVLFDLRIYAAISNIYSFLFVTLL